MTQSAPPAAPRSSTRLVLVALALAIFAVVLTNIYIEAVRRDVKRNSFSIYVLNRRVQPGDRFKKEDTKRISVPRDFEESFKALGAVMEADFDDLASRGEQFQRSAGANDILLFSQFVTPSGKGDIDRAIQPGRRLIALPVNSRRIAGELRPGISVDIQAAFNLGGSVPGVLTVMENVKVSAVGSRTIADEQADPSNARPLTGYRTISIEVSPEDATYLNMIERVMVGDFDLLLRNPDDAAVKNKGGGINPDVLNLIDQRRREPPAPKR